MGFMGFIDDASSYIGRMMGQATGNANPLTTMGIKGVMGGYTEQAARDSLVAQEVVRSFNKLGAVDAQGKRMVAKNATEAQKLVNNVKVGGNITKEQLEHIRNGVQGMDLDSARAYLGREKDGLGYWNMAKGYFGDEQLGKTRRNVVIGGAAAASVGVRYLQGGNLTTTAQGERNIAGVPFI